MPPGTGVLRRSQFRDQLLRHTMAQLLQPLLVGPQGQIPGTFVIRILPNASDRTGLQNGQVITATCPLHIGTPA